VYLPLYTMVTFTRVPYAKAARRARQQDRILYTALITLLLVGIVALAVFFGRS
jgi:kynurenine 3-monooxygenase